MIEVIQEKFSKLKEISLQKTSLAQWKKKVNIIMKFKYLRDKEKIFKLLEQGKIVHMQTIRMKQDLLTLKLEARNNGSIVAVFIVKMIFNYTSRINEGYFQAWKNSKPITLALIFLKSSSALLLSRIRNNLRKWKTQD